MKETIKASTVPSTGVFTLPAQLGGETIGFEGGGTFIVGAPIPEPTTLTLLSVGILGLAFAVWRGLGLAAHVPKPNATLALIQNSILTSQSAPEHGYQGKASTRSPNFRNHNPSFNVGAT